jgi:MFS family permease
MTENRGYVIDPPNEIMEGGAFSVAVQSVGNAAKETGRILWKAATEKAFWLFLFMLGILVPVRLVFFHFHYTFPKYGIRVLGEGVKIGNIYGVLNPVLIVFLVPLVGYLTKKISSYKMMMVGTFISAGAVFIAILPDRIFAPLMNTWVGELVFIRWLNVPVEQRQPLFFILIVFIIIFTIGEAIWSPRLMQFTAEIAPKNREGSYIALAYLPYFLAKFIAAPMSGWLVDRYTPEDALSYPEHQTVWLWIGAMAALSPFGLVAFRKLFRRAEADQEEENNKEASASA